MYVVKFDALALDYYLHSMSQEFTSREQREKEHFDELAKHGYAWWGSRTPAAKIRLQRRINLLKENLDIKPENKVLEFGCGCGDFTNKVLEVVSEKTLVYGIDVSEAQIKVAQDNIKKPNARFIVDSCTRTSFEDNYFDFVIGKSILHHLDIDDAIREIKRVLKPSGRMFFVEPNLLNPQQWLQYNVPIIRKLNQGSPDENPFYSWTIKKKLLSYNFKNVLIRPFDFIYPLIPEGLLNLAQKIESIVERTILKEIAGNLLIVAEKS